MTIVLGQGPKTTLNPPFPAWRQHYVICVEQALRYGLQEVRRKKTSNQIEEATERHLTYWLYEELLNLIQDDVIQGFTRDIFELPHLDPPTENADGSSIQKMPDLRFHLSSSQLYGQKIERLNQYAWFCECKIIEEGHSSRTYEEGYRSNGIQRFIDGQYAWAMPHAQMVAYVKWPSDKLGMGPGYTHLALDGEVNGDTCTTQHPRTHTIGGQIASYIELRHLWFKFQ